MLDITAGFSAALERPVRMEAVPRDQWETLFRSQGTTLEAVRRSLVTSNPNS
jgi:hypothetical protein